MKIGSKGREEKELKESNENFETEERNKGNRNLNLSDGDWEFRESFWR